MKLEGREWTAGELVSDILRDRDAYASSGGGVTFSGGEPLLQTDFLALVMRKLKKEKIHTAIETACFVPREAIEKILHLTDLFMCDIKTN